MVRFTNEHIMNQIELLVKQVNSHGESIKEIQSSLLAIHETQQQLQQQLKHSSLDGELAAAVKLLIHDYQNRMKTVNEGESSFVTGDSTDPKPRVVIDDQQPAKVFSSAYQLVNRMTKLEFPAFDGSEFKEWALHWHHQSFMRYGWEVIELEQLCGGSDSENVTTSSKDDVFSEDNISTEVLGTCRSPIHALIAIGILTLVWVHGVPVCLRKQLVKMLVDCGSTHNFIDEGVAKRLGLKLIPIPSKENGDFFVMPLGGYNVVLGVAWLSP
ncbi:retrotransposon-related protein [Tanacetum coccineum]